MTSPEDRIRDLVRARGIGGADAEGLLAAVRPPAPKRRNVFERWSGEVTSLAGVVVALVALAVSRMGVRFDGALDMHVVKTAVPITTALVDQLVALPLTALVMWGAARIASKRARFVDVLGVVGVSRLVTVVLAAPIALLTPHIPHEPTARPTAALWVMIVLAIICISVQIVLLVQGFRTVTAARGGRLAATFVGGLVVAELATKLVLGVF